MSSARVEVLADPSAGTDRPVHVAVTGEIDVKNAGMVCDRLLELAENSPAGLIVDLSAVPFADSSALAAFATVRAQLDGRGQDFTIVGATGSVRTVLELAGMLHVLALDAAPAAGGQVAVSDRPRMPLVGHELVFEGDRSAPGVARAAVSRWLGESNPLLDDTLLVVSELVTNVVLHSGGGGELQLTAGPPVRLEIRDRSHVIPTTIDHPGGHGGFGLRLIDQLSAAWGVEPDADGKVIWVSMPELAG